MRMQIDETRGQPGAARIDALCGRGAHRANLVDEPLAYADIGGVRRGPGAIKYRRAFEYGIERHG